MPIGSHGDTRGLIVGLLAELGDLAWDELEFHVYYKEDAEAVRHLLRVACGLDSQMLGETQILGQISQAFASARSTGTSGPLLTYLFSRAAHAGKRARSETEISQGGTSISNAAVTLLEKELGDLSSRSILVAGAGETAELAIHALRKHGAAKIRCINRTLSSAQDLALRYGCEARPWGELADALADADAVITATGSPHPVIYADDVAPVLGQRRGGPLVFVDIAVPRDVDPGVGSLPDVVLHDIDHLEATLDQQPHPALRSDAEGGGDHRRGGPARDGMAPWERSSRTARGDSMNTPERSQTPSSRVPYASLMVSTRTQKRSSRAWPTV